MLNLPPVKFTYASAIQYQGGVDVRSFLLAATVCLLLLEPLSVYAAKTTFKLKIPPSDDGFSIAVPKEQPAAPAAVQSAATITPDGNYHALVIGIDNYISQRDWKLATAVNDSSEVARILADKYGFAVTTLFNEQATHDGILNALNAYRKKLGKTDRLLIYYAGHGYLDATADASYWLPADAEKDVDTKWLDAKRITDQLKRMEARQVLVVADSCYAGTMTRGININLKNESERNSYIAKVMEKPARVLIASGGNEPVSDTGGSGHSIFSEVFLRALKEPGQSVFTAEELLVTRIKESVSGRADQTPEYRTIRNSGHDGGDFVFFRRKQ